jgi:hypothetical protein
MSRVKEPHTPTRIGRKAANRITDEASNCIDMLFGRAIVTEIIHRFFWAINQNAEV